MEALKKAIVASADPTTAEAKNPPGVEAIYKAIVDEVKWRHNWANASQLFDGFLCPLILACTPSEPAAVGTMGEEEEEEEEEEGQGDKEEGAAPSTSSSSSSATGSSDNQSSDQEAPAAMPPKMKLNRELTAQEMQWIQFAISALVRYAPGPLEANRVYMFFLQQCRAPLRDDRTINHCLVSLIYQYAQVKGNDPLLAQGLDLIQVALDRGVGLPSYEATPSVSQRQRRIHYEKELQRQGKTVKPNNNSILASVSRPILRYHRLRISEDGRTLVELPPWQPPPYQQQQQQQQASYRAPYHQHQHQQPRYQQPNQQLHAAPAPASPATPTRVAPPKHQKKKKNKKPVVVETAAAAATQPPRVEAPSAADTAATATTTTTSSSAAASAAAPAIEDQGSHPSALSNSTPLLPSQRANKTAKRAPRMTTTTTTTTTTTPRPVPRHAHHYVYSDEPSVKKTKGKKQAAVSSFASISATQGQEEDDKDKDEEEDEDDDDEDDDEMYVDEGEKPAFTRPGLGMQIGGGSGVRSGMGGRPKRQSGAGQSRKLPQIRFVVASSSSSPLPPPLPSQGVDESAPSSGAEETLSDNTTAGTTAAAATGPSKRAKKPSRFSSESATAEAAHPEATSNSTTTATQSEDEGLSRQLESMGLSDDPAQQSSSSS
ncbi:hypothetical protein DFQ27_009083 [Actinomortierella ambigua]|uniref:Uncharacterized protein n=1 Tax=Actinomortierella ambigua TaxID=1343610 RepID=A0A9P6UB74_9FUNG|nr:hypothetical protein DFQ27_009083 [Actinomortierella ambigua]